MGEGVVLLFCGRTREVIRRLEPAWDARLGGDLSPFDDVDGDGLGDLLVSYEPLPVWQEFSTRSGHPVVTYHLSQLEGCAERLRAREDYYFMTHWPVAPVGDIDGDGRTDLAAEEAERGRSLRG